MPATASMKAITYHRYGSPDVLEIRDVPAPLPGDDEILIRVRAAEATKSDCELRSLKYSVKRFWLPLRLAVGVMKPRRQILGGYFAGEIAVVGRRVVNHTVGERVFGTSRLRLGDYAQYLVLPANFTVVPMPVNMDFSDAAAVSLGGLNALHFMRLAGLREGEKVLINGGDSIGAWAVQIAQALVAEVTVVDSALKEAFARRLGADHFIDYQKQRFADQRGVFDVMFDMMAGSDYADCLSVLKPDGRYLAGNPRLALMLRSIITN